jgi:1-acyl-sn-glycerol-3-phosphate acyltransferase
MGSLETLVLNALLLPFGDLTFVVKESLLSYPVFGLLLKGVDPIAVSRRNAREDLKQTLDQGMKMIQRGRSVVIFPQATRSTTFDSAAFNSLGVKLARKAGVPAIPLALKTDFVQNGTWIKDFGRIMPEKTIYMEFGPPVNIEDNGKAQHQAIKAFIIDRLKTWGAEVIEDRSPRHTHQASPGTGEVT